MNCLIYCDFALLLRCGVVFIEVVDRVPRFSVGVCEIRRLCNFLDITLISHLTVLRQLYSTNLVRHPHGMIAVDASQSSHGFPEVV